MVGDVVARNIVSTTNRAKSNLVDLLTEIGLAEISISNEIGPMSSAPRHNSNSFHLAPLAQKLQRWVIVILGPAFV